MPPGFLVKVVSGGQTGVDRAALDVALERGIPCGGWCPHGRRAEDGRIPARYPLSQTPSAAYPQRTAWNVRDSNGTLVLTAGPADRGTALTLTLAERFGKPLLHLDLEGAPRPEQATGWVRRHWVRVLNVAGPRESRCPGISAKAGWFLREVLDRLAGEGQ